MRIYFGNSSSPPLLTLHRSTKLTTKSRGREYGDNKRSPPLVGGVRGGGGTVTYFKNLKTLIFINHKLEYIHPAL